MREASVSFHHDRPARHPVRNTFLNRIEVTVVPEAPSAADSSIARFHPKDASLTRDECGVILRLSNGDEFVYGWQMVSEAKNIRRDGDETTVNEIAATSVFNGKRPFRPKGSKVIDGKVVLPEDAA